MSFWRVLQVFAFHCVVFASCDAAQKTGDGLFFYTFYFQSYTARMGEGEEGMGKVKQNSQDKSIKIYVFL